MKKPNYKTLFERACERKGGEAAVEELLPSPASHRKLSRLSSDRYLAEFTRKIFQSGFVWRVVNQKWDGFEEVFWNFDVERLVMMPDDMLERKAQDTKIIRNHSKVKTVRENAVMIAETERREDKRFGRFIADWPAEDVVGLWLYLKKHGSRLGGNTGPYALRELGVDTFMLTQDIEGFLRSYKIIEGGLSSKKSLLATQAFFNDLRAESGRSLSELSRLVAMGFGKNWLGVSSTDE